VGVDGDPESIFAADVAVGDAAVGEDHSA